MAGRETRGTYRRGTKITIVSGRTIEVISLPIRANVIANVESGSNASSVGANIDIQVPPKER
jgi:hypothetical protein